MNEPEKILLRRKDVLAWAGISEYDFDELLKAKILIPTYLRPNSRAYYHKEHVREKIINKFKTAA